MTRTKIILGVLLLAIVVPSASAVSLPSFFDEPCSGNPTNTLICEGVNLINDELEAQILRINSINATQILQGIDIGTLQGNITSLDSRLTTTESEVTSINGVDSENANDITAINATLIDVGLETLDNTQRVDGILFNSTSFNGTSFIEVDAEQSVQDADISSLQSSVSSVQTQANTHDTDIAAIHEHVDVVNRNIAIGPLPVPQLMTDYTAICNDGSQTKIPGSEIATLTNGVNTTSNIPELVVGTLDVIVNYTDTRLTFKMTVTNANNVTGLSGEAYVTCLTYPN